MSGAQVPVSRLTTISIPGDTLNFDELQMDILLDEEWKSYSEHLDVENYDESIVASVAHARKK